jgi:hypothetical protein
MSIRTNAEKFIEDQIKIMSKHGSTPKLSKERYEEAVAGAERTFAAMQKAEPVGDERDYREQLLTKS